VDGPFADTKSTMARWRGVRGLGLVLRFVTLQTVTLTTENLQLST